MSEPHHRYAPTRNHWTIGGRKRDETKEMTSIGMMANPLVGMALDPSAMDMNEEMMMVREAQKEHELRITWDNVVSSVLFCRCVFSCTSVGMVSIQQHFGKPLIFWFTASFALQAILLRVPCRV